MEHQNRNIYHLFHGASVIRGNQPCLILPDGSHWTGADLANRAQQFAAALVDTGLQVEDRVLVQVDKSPDAVALYLACLFCGAVMVPLNTAYTGAELDYFLHDAEPKVLVVRPDQASNLAGMARRGGATLLTLGSNNNGSLAELAVQVRVPGSGPVPRHSDDLAAILYTSGTTGRSKGAMLSHGNLASNAQTLCTWWQWQDSDVLLHMLPIFHVHGLFVALHCALFSGTPMLFEPRFDAQRLLALLPRATVLMGVPTFYSRLLEQPGFTRETAAHMRLFISGSAPLTEQVFNSFTERTGHRILERYGMSETVILTSNPVPGDRVAGTVGFPLPGVQLRVTDDQGGLLPAGETGAIEVRGPGVFRGYWRMPEKTLEEFRDHGWFSTGDLGFQAADGRVTLVGRSKDLVISGGYNIYPKEIERLLDALPGILESAVIGVPHPDLGEALVAAVVPEAQTAQQRADASALDTNSINSLLSDDLARFKQPRQVVLVDALPRNAMGKVQKNVLRELWSDLFQPAGQEPKP